MHCTVRLFEQNKICFSITFHYNLSSEMSANSMAIKTFNTVGQLDQYNQPEAFAEIHVSF